MNRRFNLLSAVLATLTAALMGCTAVQQQTPATIPPTEAPTESATATPQPTAAPTEAPTEMPQPTVEPTAAPTATPIVEGVGAAGIGDPYFPLMGNGGYDVLHYDIDVDVDMDAMSLSAVTTIEAEAQQDLDQFNLDFVGMTIDTLTVNGEPADYERTSGELIISPAAELAEGEPFTVAVSYSGTPGEGLPPSSGPEYTEGWQFYDNGVFVAGEPSGSSGWYPVNEHPLDKATYTFEITVAEPWVAAANGVLVNEIDEGAARTYEWEMDDPAASYLITVAIGNFDVVTGQTGGGIPLRNYFAASVPDITREQFQAQADMIDFYETVFGPYPFDTYGAVVHDRPFSFALETQTLSTFGRTFVNEEVISHELSHMWFGDNISLAKWQDIWLNEGFATYASALWDEHQDGPEALASAMHGIYRSIAQTAEFTVNPAELSNLMTRIPFENGVTFTPQQAADAVTAMFGSDIPQEDVLSQIDEWGYDSLSFNQFGRLLVSLPTDVEGEFNRDTVYDFLVKLGQPELATQLGSPFVIGDPSPDALFAGDVYQRGALTLHALRQRIGDEAFFELLRTYTERFGGSNASTQDFIALAEEISGQDLEAFFDGWLYHTDLPDIPELGWSADDFRN